eukprot:scaffold48260_cov69-Phaeocystis_antarctica.AAC.3
MGGDFSKNLQSESLMSFGNVPEDTSTLERVDFASDPYNFGWCADNPLQCTLATVDFLPLVGSVARCGQLAVQALEGDIGEDTAFNCELNAAGDIIPGVGKVASKAFKVGAKAAKATKAAVTLRVAKTAAAKEGMSQAERNAALMELGRASEDYTKVVAREARKAEKIAAETLEREANEAAIIAREEQEAFAAAAEKRAAEWEARDAKIKQLLKEGGAKHEAEVAALKMEEEAEVAAVKREEGIQAAKKRGIKENKVKDTDIARKAAMKDGARKAARYAKLKVLATIAAEPVLTVLNCREGMGDLAVYYATSHYGELPPAYTLNPQCPEVAPPRDRRRPYRQLEDPIIPAGGPEDRKQPTYDPDFIPYNQSGDFRVVGAASDTSLYVLFGAIVVVGAATYAYYKF